MDVALVLTHACNLACAYCYTGEKKQVAMPREIARAALDLAFSNDDPGSPLQVSFFGGEPLLAFDHLEEIATEARSRATLAELPLTLQVTTNGTLLDEARLDTLTRLGVHIALSLDGTRASHDVSRRTKGGGPSYDSTRRALDLLLARKERFDVIAVVHPGNVKHLGDSVRELFDLGVRSLTFNVDWGGAWDEGSLAALASGYEAVAAVYLAWLRRGQTVRIEPLTSVIYARSKGSRGPADTCGAGRSRLAVAPSGRLYGCSRSVGEDTGKGSIGHVTERATRAQASGPTTGAPECATCPASGRCERHCACACREETGDPGVPGPVLCTHQHLLEGLAARLFRALERDEARGPSFHP